MDHRGTRQATEPPDRAILPLPSRPFPPSPPPPPVPLPLLSLTPLSLPSGAPAVRALRAPAEQGSRRRGTRRAERLNGGLTRRARILWSLVMPGCSVYSCPQSGAGGALGANCPKFRRSRPLLPKCCPPPNFGEADRCPLKFRQIAPSNIGEAKRCPPPHILDSAPQTLPQNSEARIKTAWVAVGWSPTTSGVRKSSWAPKVNKIWKKKLNLI